MSRDIITSAEIGAAIRKRRKALGFSQEQLAEKVGVSYQQVQRYENGSSTLNVETVQRIARALGVPATIFFDAGSVQGVVESVASFLSSEEKTMLRFFRALPTPADRKLAISVMRRFIKR